ncbi:hypothetical protein [Lysinibacillus yapensis]|nr:hypothetical protein [Lysinibacillus yapensis]
MANDRSNRNSRKEFANEANVNRSFNPNHEEFAAEADFNRNNC